MPLRDKLIIAFTVLLVLVGPYMAYKMIETGMNKDIELTRTMSDGSAAPLDREVAEIAHRHLPPIVIGQVAMFITAQIGMVILSALLIRGHKRRLKRRS
jgi:hypothetical protein